MANYIRKNEPTPNGGAYSEIFFFYEIGNNADETKAVRCVIRECAENGDLINEIRGVCDPNP